MITGIVYFLCVVLCCVLLFIGYLSGVRYAINKLTDAYINAMFEYKIDPNTIEKVYEKTCELLKKEAKETDL